VNVKIYEARRHHESFCVEDLGVGFQQIASQGLDATVFKEEVRDFIHVLRRVDHPSALNEQLH